MATIVSRKLHEAFVAAAHEVRNRLGAADISGFHLRVEVEGRTLSDADSALITYKIAKSTYSNGVEGNDLEVVLVEYLRRNGWDQRNAPLALAAPRKRRVDAE
jgi:hypothetical protein